MTPIKSALYGFPVFPPTGDDNLDKLFAGWVQQVNDIYSRNLFELEGRPTASSTAAVGVPDDVTTAPVVKNDLILGLTGGEQVMVFAHAELFSRDGNQVFGRLKVTYPSGSTFTSTQNFGLDIAAGSSVIASVAQFWQLPNAVEAGLRLQGPGKYTFAVTYEQTSGGSTNSASWDRSNLTVLRF